MSANPTPAFEAFARGEGDADDVFRTLVGYGDYLAPPPGAPRGAASPADELWVYTDPEAVARASAQEAGLVPGASGLDLFGATHEGVVAIRVNPASPPALGWNVPAAAFEVALAWANGVRFERELAEWAVVGPLDRGGGHMLLLAYRHYQCYLTPEGAVLTAPGHSGFANPAIACTAPDCGRRVLARVGEPLRGTLRAAWVAGEELFGPAPPGGVDGVVLNPAGPGPTLAVALTGAT